MEVVDSIDLLIFTLKFCDSNLLKIPSDVRLKVITVKTVNPYDALNVLYNALQHIDDEYLKLKCYIALLRLQAIVERYRKIYKLCDKSLKFAERALKYKRML